MASAVPAPNMWQNNNTPAESDQAPDFGRHPAMVGLSPVVNDKTAWGVQCGSVAFWVESWAQGGAQFFGSWA